ncbi:MAG: hypothetical protein Q7U04_11025 [Bacteriovorax sp.]|nr:hypothetical protein [Bacteriovorax sp.]
MIKKLQSLFGSFKQYKIDDTRKLSLDIILSNSSNRHSLEDRIEWLQQLFKWILADSYYQHTNKVPVVKIKFFLLLLDRNEIWKKNVCTLLQKTLLELSAIEFFCELGLPSQIGFIGEFGDKLMDKVLPRKPIGNQLGELLLNLFPEKQDTLWIASIDEVTLDKIFELFTEDNKIHFPHLLNDIEESLIYLVSQIVAIGLSPLIRKRIPHSKMTSLPFFSLSSHLDLYLKTKKQVAIDSSILNLELETAAYCELNILIGEAGKAVKEVYFHLDKFGVSIHLVYQLERLQYYLHRTIALLEINQSNIIPKKQIVLLTAELINQSLTQRSIKSLISGNVNLLFQKIVERTSKTGEHYIAQNSHEYWLMLRSALGGGLITSFTVYLKNLILLLPVTKFIIGSLGSLNYAGSFLLIQFSGFTLGTKQPASTASALAQKLELLERVEQVENVTDEIVMISRTQFVAVLGNLLAVIPAVLFINICYHFFVQKWIVDLHSAEHNLHSTDLFGPAIIYATFTGFLLWLSSVVSGWAENWFAFNNLHYLLSNNKKCKLILSKSGAVKLANFLENNISGIVANISLGFLLGLFPELLNFIGIPLHVLHVTLSTGAIAASIPSLGVGIFETALFWRSIIGLAAVGFINIFVSFSFAFFVAVRAKKISSIKRRLIYRSVMKRFLSRPASFFIPRN